MVVLLLELLDLQHLKHIFVSPRLRARRTFELLFTSPSSSSSSLLPPFVTEPNVQEWDYGAYEGLRTNEIVAMRGTTSFDIWTQGCQGGESTEEMTQRVDCMIEKIVKIQKEHFDTQGKEEEEDFGDVLIVSHGRTFLLFFFFPVSFETPLFPFFSLQKKSNDHSLIKSTYSFQQTSADAS